MIKVFAQGKHRYWSLEGPDIARMLEGLNVLAGRGTPASSTPEPLRAARTCYGHLAGTLAVALHDHFCASKWLSTARADSYHLTPGGEEALAVLGIDLAAVRKQRRRFAYACLDWSERRPHLGGAVGAGLLKLALARKWVEQELDSRALEVTDLGRREMARRFGLHF